MVAVAVAGAAVVRARTAACDNELELCEDLVCELVEALLCAKVGNVYGVLCNLGVERVDSLLNGFSQVVCNLSIVLLCKCIGEDILLCIVFCNKYAHCNRDSGGGDVIYKVIYAICAGINKSTGFTDYAVKRDDIKCTEQLCQYNTEIRYQRTLDKTVLF